MKKISIVRGYPKLWTDRPRRYCCRCSRFNPGLKALAKMTYTRIILRISILKDSKCLRMSPRISNGKFAFDDGL